MYVLNRDIIKVKLQADTCLAYANFGDFSSIASNIPVFVAGCEYSHTRSLIKSENSLRPRFGLRSKARYLARGRVPRRHGQRQQDRKDLEPTITRQPS